MNKSELITKVAAAAETSKTTAEDVINALGDVATATLAAGDEVTLPGLGKLSATTRAAREGRNPATGDAITIPARRAPKFGAAKALKDALNAAPAKGKAKPKK